MQIKTFSDLKAAVRQLDGVRITNPIRKSIKELDFFIGVNVSASSVIRKEAHTKNMLQQFCDQHNLILQDPYPYSNSLQILLNLEKW